MNETGVNVCPCLNQFYTFLNYIAMIKLTQIPQPEKCKYVINVHYKVFPIDRYGNTYHRVKIGFYIGNEWTEYDSGLTYGYGEHYKETACKWILNNIKFTGKYEKERKAVVKENRLPTEYYMRKFEEAKYLKVVFTPVDYLTRKK